MTQKLKWAFLLILFTFLLGSMLACDVDDDDDDNDDDSQSDDDDDDDNDSGDDDDNNDDTGDDDTGDDDDDDDSGVEGPYYQDFLQYWQAMDEGYAYFIEKEIDWDAVLDAYSTSAFSETDESDFALMIAQITASLADSHTMSSLPGVPENKLPYRQATGVCLERIGDGVYVSRLTAEAETEGMQLGDEVTALDDQPVDEVLSLATSWEGCSTPHCCDFYKLPHVERYAQGEESVNYSVLRGTTPLAFDMERSGSGASTCKRGPLLDFLADASGTVLRYKPLDDDLGHVHLSTLNGGYEDQILAELDQALSEFAGRSGIIFDARYNHGGSDLVAMKVLQRFLDRLVIPVSVRYKNGPEHDDFTIWIPEPVLAGSSPTDVPVVFLVNGGCISAADFFVAAASYVPTFTLLGTTSCGGTGAPDNFTLNDTGITVYYSQMQRRYVATGEQVEGIGIAPDLLVEQDPLDLKNGIDTQIEAAAEFLRGN